MQTKTERRSRVLEIYPGVLNVSRTHPCCLLFSSLGSYAPASTLHKSETYKSWLSFVTRFCASCVAFLVIGCSTGRTPVPPGTIPEEPYVSAEDERYGAEVLSELTKNYPLERDDQAIGRVRELVTRLTRAAHADQNPWNVFVLQGDDVINAAATRGNYVFVWTGMLREAQSDGELATVVAHELGHLLAGHTQPTPAEEASQIMAQASGRIAGQIVATQPGYAPLAQLTSILVSEAIKAFVVNPGAQSLELEADHIGFFVMADAGYDPHEALSLWSRMAENPTTGGAGLQFLSSHPASSERLEVLRALLPEAEARYQRARQSVVRRPASSKERSPRDRDDDSFAIEPGSRSRTRRQ